MNVINLNDGAHGARRGDVRLAVGRRLSYTEWGNRRADRCWSSWCLPSSRRADAIDLTESPAPGCAASPLTVPASASLTRNRVARCSTRLMTFALGRQLGLRRPFAVLGTSGGGPYAAACASRCPTGSAARHSSAGWVRSIDQALFPA